MAKLMKRDQQVDTVFELLGTKEDDMTYSLGWALAECNVFNRQLATMLGLNKGFSDAMQIQLQKSEPQMGRTDIEIVDPEKVHIVIEAKQGFDIPPCEQLEKYADRLLESPYTKAKKMLLVLAESDREDQWLRLSMEKMLQQVSDNVKQVEVKAISWRDFQKLAQESIKKTNNNAEKRLLHQLNRYLEKVLIMQNQNSNRVLVVSAGDTVFLEDKISSVVAIEKHQKYFHPIGNGWPKEPPNYIAFRYNRKLQSIHHIESSKVIEDYKQVEAFNLQSSHPIEKHYLYELGPAIEPKNVRTNDKTKRFKSIPRNTHCWCYLDLLLTCDSVSEALVKTKERMKEEEKRNQSAPSAKNFNLN